MYAALKERLEGPKKTPHRFWMMREERRIGKLFEELLKMLTSRQIFRQPPNPCHIHPFLGES